MKNIKNVLFVIALAVVGLASCKNEKAQVKQATTETVTPVQKPSNSPVASQVTTQPAVPVGPTTTVRFENEVHDFGTVMEGDIVTHSYKFTNTGKEPLVLSNVKPACGCTTPTWPREPIAPGATGTIEARFDTKGKGAVGGKKDTKTITITANTEPSKTTLRITGIIDKKEASK